MLEALRLLTASPPLNTVLILPDGDEEIMTHERDVSVVEEVAMAGCILRIRVLLAGVNVCMVIQESMTSVKSEMTACSGMAGPWNI